MKKRVIAFFLALALTCGALCISVNAAFGSGVAVIAEEGGMVKTGLLGKKLCFSDGDFKSAFTISDFESITVTSLPSSLEGTLLLAGRRIHEGDEIKRKNIAAMVFVPASADVTEASFKFILNAGAGTESVCRMRFTDKVNYAPRAEEEKEAGLSLTTQADISLFGRLRAEDPEGDAMEFIIVSYPKNGVVRLTDKGTGRYKYTPSEGFSGYDKFSFVARDEYGNYSDVTTVGIRVIERMSDEVFCDMTDRGEYNAAVAMSALGIMGSTRVGDDLYFMPEEAITKAEFVAMAMKACGIGADTVNAKSFFDDNDEIPTSLVGYVAKAQRMGVIDGSFGKSGLIFNPNAPITKYEAAMIMAELIGIGETEDEVYLDTSDVPIFARSGVGAMITLGIFDTDGEDIDFTSGVTRAEGALYLYRLIAS